MRNTQKKVIKTMTQIDAIGNVTVVNYDKNGLIITIEGRNKRPYVTKYSHAFDEHGRTTTIDNHNHPYCKNNEVIKYDTCGRITFHDYGNHSITRIFNDHGILEREIVARDGMEIITKYLYTHGFLTEKRCSHGKWVIYKYDFDTNTRTEYLRLRDSYDEIGENYQEKFVESVTFDERGNAIHYDRGLKHTWVEYDDIGNKLLITDHNGRQVKYQYNDNDDCIMIDTCSIRTAFDYEYYTDEELAENSNEQYQI